MIFPKYDLTKQELLAQNVNIVSGFQHYCLSLAEAYLYFSIVASTL